MNNQQHENGKMLTIMLAFIFIVSIASFFFLGNQTALTEKEKMEICPTCHFILGQR